MKKYLIILCSVIVLFSFSGCEKENSESVNSDVDVIINMPTDDTVNGYRINKEISNNETPNQIAGSDVGTITSETLNKNSKAFCGNKNSKVFHKSDCGSVSKMKENNKYFADRITLLSEGYTPCGSCKP